MAKIEYFDYEKLAQKMHVPKVVLKRIEKEVREEFPTDKMMYELHVLRAVKSGYWRQIKLKTFAGQKQAGLRVSIAHTV